MVPQSRAWHDRFEPAWFKIVGVYTPDFFWERSTESASAATRKPGIRYPVVQDNDSVIWKRCGVYGWPTTVPVDRRGILPYRRIGGGAYGETEALILRLLRKKVEYAA